MYAEIMAMPDTAREQLLAGMTTVPGRELDMEYQDQLNEAFGSVSICGYDYAPSDALRAVDPASYDCGFADFVGTDGRYTEIGGHIYMTEELKAAHEEWVRTIIDAVTCLFAPVYPATGE